MANVKFQAITENDYTFILKVYNYFIENSTATFHTGKISVNELKQILPFRDSMYETYIILYNNQACGYCYINNWKPRPAYKISAEISLYIMPEFQGKGIGSKTLKFLEKEAKQKGIMNLLGVITAENSGSVALFSKMRYEKVSHLKNIGEKFGRLLDVVTYQKEI